MVVIVGESGELPRRFISRAGGSVPAKGISVPFNRHLLTSRWKYSYENLKSLRQVLSSLSFHGPCQTAQ
jgi:hypothetical protein